MPCGHFCTLFDIDSARSGIYEMHSVRQNFHSLRWKVKRSGIGVLAFSKRCHCVDILSTRVFSMIPVRQITIRHWSLLARDAILFTRVFLMIPVRQMTLRHWLPFYDASLYR
ncbi:hypothetical protein AMTR_s00078p00069730 [Amborella trichopoda]|uniref:Uncharacterized protein n=1 Tax=Amborella trichopoda TaxID=13333 RepID=W1P9U5_AMBTC|nr:hypothetical protein AMTR_s00078p00069730 [Amborella trichopoda]